MLRLYLNNCFGALARGTVLVSGALAVAATAPARGACPVAGSETVRARVLMGTVLEVRLPPSTPGAEALEDAVFAEVAALEAAASTWRDDSELERLHREGATSAPVSERLAEVLEAAVRARDLSAGAFDPTIGALVSAYGLHGAGRWPDPSSLGRARALVGTHILGWDGARRRLTLARGARLDLDGVAKGVALDRAVRLLRERGVVSALLNFGGQISVVGPPVPCPPRRVEVAPPDGSVSPVLAVAVRDASVSTSSNAERGHFVDGRPFGHLLDPRTGRFAAAAGSVTVVASTGALADGLSTALFVDGPEGWEPLKARHAGTLAGVAAAFVVPDGAGGLATVADQPFERLRPPGPAPPAGPPAPSAPSP